MTYAITPAVPADVTKNLRIQNATEHLLGICNGLIADQKLNPQEIEYLNLWLKQHPESHSQWPGLAIADRIKLILEDGVISDEECSDLLALLKEVCGNDFHETGSTDNRDNSGIPFDLCPVIFQGHSFCLTGTFATASRSNVAKKIKALGGEIHDRVKGHYADDYSTGTNYLVIGTGGSRGWAHGSYGNKIQDALHQKTRHMPINIISEKQWFAALLAEEKKS